MGRRKQWPPQVVFHAASGQSRVYVEGRYVYLGKAGTPEAQKAYDDLIAKLEAQRQPEAGPSRRDGLTVAELCERYMAWARGYYTKNGKPTGQIQRVERALELTCKRHAATTAAQFGPLALEEVRDDMVALGWRRGTVNSHTGCIKRAWKWAASRELIPAGVAQAVAALPGLRKGRTPAPESPGVGPVSDDLVEATLPWLRPEVADMVRIQRLTGMRGGEVCALRASEIDRTGEVWVWRPADHKTAHAERSRVILFGPKAQAILLPHLARGGYVFSPARVVASQHRELREARRSKVQPSQVNRKKATPKRQPGDRYTTNSYQAAIRRACRRAGLPEWRTGQLRHAAATELRRKFGIDAAQAVLGHAHVSTTEIYAEKQNAAAVDAMKKAG